MQIESPPVELGCITILLGFGFSTFLWESKMDEDMYWEDYDDGMMQDYMPTLEDLEAMGVDVEELKNLPDDALYELLQQYMMGGQPGNMMDPDYGGPGMAVDKDFSLAQHVQNCMIPVAWQGVQMMIPVLLLCGSLRISAVFQIPISLLHLVCACSGLFLLWNTFEMQALYIVGLTLLAYLLLSCLYYSGAKNKGPICGVVCIATLILWELFLADPVDWHKIRGAQMILVMKVISLGFDLDHGTVPAMVGIEEYLGYTFCVGTVMFGPWIGFNSYIQMLQPSPPSLQWACSVVFHSVMSMVCLVVSVCVDPSLFTTYQSKWLHAYGDAASFRFSHYFVSYASSASIVLAGCGARTEPEGSTKWEFSVAKPLHIEVPRSLVEVVTNWNLPMHYWLKNYVFKTSRSLGNFAAVILTYATSSVLHGLNFQLAAVLLSLGVYSYIEYVFRRRLAEIFNACIKAKKCKGDCPHQHKSTNPWVLLINLMFGCLAVFHLAYLGVMFNTDSELQEEGYTMQHTLDTWAGLDYASHYVVLGTYVFYWLIK